MLHAISYQPYIPEQFSAALIPQNQRRYSDNISMQLTLDEAIAYLEQELARLNADKATIYTHYQEIKSPQLRKQNRNDSSVVLEFSIGNNSYRMISASWQLVDHNLYSLHMVLRQIQGMLKWNVISLAAMLSPFEIGAASQASPVKETSDSQTTPHISQWMSALGLGPTATSGDISAVYHRRAKLCETEEELVKLNALVDEARKAVV